MKISNWIPTALSLLLFSHITCTESSNNETNVKQKVVLSNVKVSVHDKEGNALTSASLKYPTTLKESIIVSDSQQLRFSFTAKKVHQQDSEGKAIKLNLAVAILNHTETGTLNYLSVKSTKGAIYKLFLGPKKLPKFITRHPGNYEVTILAGGIDNVDSVKYNIGNINFDVNAKDYKHNEFGALPVIEHQFRQPDKVANPILSFIFSGLVVSPWLLLLFLWNQLNANIKEFPINEPTALLSSLTFLACLIGYLTLAFFYWIKLTIFEALFYLAPLILVTVISGRFALSHAQVRFNRIEKK